MLVSHSLCRPRCVCVCESFSVLPFDGSVPEVRAQLLSYDGDVPLRPFPPLRDEPTLDLMRCLLHPDPTQRLGSAVASAAGAGSGASSASLPPLRSDPSAVQSHPYFSGVDWSAIEQRWSEAGPPCAGELSLLRDQFETGTEAEQPAPPSSTHVSPAMRIYRHALEVICGMLELQDLIQILAVSRSWSAAVRSMAPIKATIESDGRSKAFCQFPSIRSIVASPILCHLAAIQISASGRDGVFWTPLGNECLRLLAQHAPNLTSLCCDLTLTPTDSLIWPATLTSLTVHLDGEYCDTEINDVLATLAALPSLSTLCLELTAFTVENAVELGLLGASRSLTELTLDSSGYNEAPLLSAAQVDQLRSSLGHLTRFCAGMMKSDDLARLLRPSVTARWKDIGFLYGDARIGPLLLRLPSLTTLYLLYREDAVTADFLPQLPQLTSLTWDSDDSKGRIPADPLLASLLLCTAPTSCTSVADSPPCIGLLCSPSQDADD